MDWKAISPVGWVNISPDSGNLPSGESVTVTMNVAGGYDGSGPGSPDGQEDLCCDVSFEVFLRPELWPPPPEPPGGRESPDSVTLSVIRVLPSGMQAEAYGLSQNHALMAAISVLITALSLAIQLFRGR